MSLRNTIKNWIIMAVGVMLITAGVLMHFTKNIGYGDPETARQLIYMGLSLLLGYTSGYLIAYTARE